MDMILHPKKFVKQVLANLINDIKPNEWAFLGYPTPQQQDNDEQFDQ